MTIRGTNISMVRGDTETIIINFAGYDLVSGDLVELTVRESTDSEVLIHKAVQDFSDNSAMIVIESEDTSNLDFGTYYYDIQLTHSGGKIMTVVKKSKFKLEEEITYG